jgi:hypothetical protein
MPATLTELNGTTPLVRPKHEPTQTTQTSQTSQTSQTAKSVWQQEIEDGACSIEEFFDELRRQIREHFHEERHNLQASSK